jgi:putative ABC transport system permease protein
MAVMLRDLVFAVRTLRRAPGFAVSAILALGLGIGANTAVFSVVYAVLLAPLPYDSPERLVRLYESNRSDGVERGEVSAGTFVDWRARTRTLETMAGYNTPFGGETLWTLGDKVHVVKASAVSPALFAMLHVVPVLGRTFRGEQDPAPPGALGQFVIGYGLWQRAFGGAADVIGRTVMIEGRLPREIVGVMPRGFAFPDGTEAWTSMPMATVAPAARRARTFQGIARLSPHVTIDDVRRELDGISAQLASEQPASNAGWTARVEPLAGSDTASTRPALIALMAAVAGVLLIGCANVANLLFARATARRREMAVRVALGAGVSRLIRQCLVEAALLCVAGVAAGLVLGQWLAGVLVRLAPPDIPRLGDVGMSGAVLLFAVAAGVLSAGLTGLAPALQAARADVHGGLRPDARSATPRGARLRRRLLAGQVAIVVVLLTGALLLVRTFVNLRRIDLGFETEHVVEVETRWPVGRLLQAAPGTRPWANARRADDGLLTAVGELPGVDAVGIVTDAPLTPGSFEAPVWRADAPGASGLTPPPESRYRWSADVAIVSAGYFPVLDIPFLRGRNFMSADRLSDAQLNDSTLPRSAVAIVNAAFASRYFPGEDPVGHTVIVPDDQQFGSSKTIIGVVADVRGRAVGEAPAPALFIPHAQHAGLIRPSLVVRSALPPDAIARAIRERISAYDPTLFVQRIRPMHDVVSGALSWPRFNLVLLSSFAAVALLLSAVGIYGVLAYLVTQRTREIGIRMAIGARAADVLRLLLREGMTPVVWGACAGVVGSMLLTRALRTLLYGVTPLDAISLAAAPALLLAVALLACYLPARRATRVDPLIALRED